MCSKERNIRKINEGKPKTQPEDFRILPVRKLQDLDEKARGQMQTKRFPSGSRGWKGIGVQE